jgi:hypothetical protein
LHSGRTLLGMELSDCPECGHPAEVVAVSRTDGAERPEEIVGVRCIDRHWFLGLRDRLVPRVA